jgi:hypothetical protein
MKDNMDPILLYLSAVVLAGHGLYSQMPMRKSVLLKEECEESVKPLSTKDHL